MLVYCMMIVACSVTEMGLGSQILPIISAPTYYANPQNEWGSLIVPHLRKQLIVTDPDAVTYFFEGLPKGMSIPWGVWIKPWGSWALYAVLSVVGSVLMLSAAIWLQDFLRPPAAKTLGPEGMVFLLPVFPFVLTGIAAFVARLAIYR